MTQKVLSSRIKDALLKAKNLIFDKSMTNDRETTAHSEDFRGVAEYNSSEVGFGGVCHPTKSTRDTTSVTYNMN